MSKDLLMSMSHSVIAAEEYLPDIRNLLKTFSRHRRLAFLVACVSMIVGTILVFSAPTSYKASALIVLEDKTTKLANFDDVTEGDKFSDLSVQTEVKVLSSSNLALQTIKATNLEQYPEFSSTSGDFQETLRKFSDKMTILPQGSSRVIEISFKAHDPEVAAAVVNAHVAAYLDYQVNLKTQKVEKLRGWFEEKVKDLKEDVVKKAQAVGKYRAEENLAIGKDSQELVYQQITSVSEQLVPLQVRKYETQAKLETLAAAQKSGNMESIGEVVNSGLIQKLREQESVLSQQYESEQTKFGVNHPSLISTKQELGDVRKSILSEVSKIAGSLRNDLSSANAQEEMLKLKLEELKKQADNLREKLVVLNSLVVEQDASQKLLDNFLGNYQNIQSQTSFAQADAVVASPAITPNVPAPPGKMVLLLVVIIFSACLSAGTVFLIEIVRGGLTNFDDVRKIGQNPLGIVPIEANPVHVMLTRANSTLKEAIKRIYMAGLMDKKACIALVTSALPKEGRTTFVALMAYYLVSIGHKVLVIDADFVNPSLGVFVGGGQGPGFADVLAKNASWNEAIWKNESGLYVVNAGSRSPVSPNDLTSANLSNLLAQLKDKYSYILIDSGPILAFSEATALAAQADGVFVVAEWARTPLPSIKNMFNALKTISTPVLGVVLNKVDLDKYKASSDGAEFLLPKISHSV